MRLECEAGRASIKNAYLQSLLAEVAAKLTHVSPHPTGAARPAPHPSPPCCSVLGQGYETNSKSNPRQPVVKLRWRHGSAERVTKTCFSYSAACLAETDTAHPIEAHPSSPSPPLAALKLVRAVAEQLDGVVKRKPKSLLLPPLNVDYPLYLQASVPAPTGAETLAASTVPVGAKLP